MAKISIKLPVIVMVDDYHEFWFLEKHFKKLNKSIKLIEEGFDYNTKNYVGIVYTGKTPSKKAIKALCAECDFDGDDGE